MKKQNTFRKLAGALVVGAAVVAATPASALTFTWLTGPQTGQVFTGGGVQVKAINYDTGTIYNPLPVGTAVGTGVGGTTVGVDAGVTALNGLAGQRAPINAMPGEDSWGILKITSIQSFSGGVLHDIYNHAVNTYELTALFGGVQDFYVHQASLGSSLPAGGQIIDGRGLTVSIYSDNTPDFSQVPGPGARVGNTYPTVTDGVLELVLQSTPGFINAANTYGGIPTEFESNTAATGYAALNVVGGASAAQFNTNAIGFRGSSGAEFMPGLGAQTSTDVWFAFTSSQGVNGWDITSNDPMLAHISPVPDSGSTLALMGLSVVLLGFGYRIRNRRA